MSSVNAFSGFAARLRSFIDRKEGEFDGLATELFGLQFDHNGPYRRFCEARGVRPGSVGDWREIPAMPTSAFKEWELSCLPPEQHTRVFYSSGTTEQRPSRHFHNAASLEIYEASLWSWFAQNVLGDGQWQSAAGRLLILTPPPEDAPNSSLVHMLETVQRRLGAEESAFLGSAGGDGAWRLDTGRAIDGLRQAWELGEPALLLGTAFSFVHLLDFLGEHNLSFRLPAGSRAMETGGYKGRSRSLPKAELYALITRQLDISGEHIICEYGMSELGSQAYESVAGDKWRVTSDRGAHRHSSRVTRHFHFPPWARAQIVSPETGREVNEGETGLIRVFDLANVYSVAAIQTEDLGIRHRDGFALVGRAAFAESRGCSLMAV